MLRAGSEAHKHTQTPRGQMPKANSKVVRNKKIKAMAIAGVTHQEIAKQTGLSKSGVTKIISQSFTPEQLKAFRESEPALIGLKRQEILLSISEQDLEKAGLSQKAMAYGVLFDKDRILQDKSTVNVNFNADVISASVAELRAILNVDNPVDNPPVEMLISEM